MRSLIALSAALLVAGSVVAQQSQSTPASQPVFRTSTRLVQVSVVVHDGRNQPVRGLRAEDFQVLEDGKEQPVTFFSVHGIESVVSSTATAAAKTFTNRIQSPSGGGVVAIVYDRLNTAHLDRTRVREHIVKYLAQVNPDDRIGLYVLDAEGMGILHDFTRDARSLVRVLSTVKTKSTAADVLESPAIVNEAVFGDALDRQLAEFASSGEVSFRSMVERQVALQTIEGLESVARHLQGVPGRKNLVWVSSGFPFIIRSFGPPTSTQTEMMSMETARAARALNDADVAVYVVDARGLVGAFASSPSEKNQRFTTLATVQTKIEGLRQFADLTGGAAYFNTNDIGGAIARAVEDSRLTYVLGYYSDEKAWDGKFRRIKVKVGRKGVDVRHRAGYFAIPGSALPQQTRSDAVLEALQSPLESTALPMTVSVESAAQGKVTLAIRFEPGLLMLEKRGATWHGAIDIAIAQTLPAGRQTAETDITIPLALDDGTRAQFLKEGLRLTRTITLRDDAEDVRVVGRDHSSGATGSIIIPASALRATRDP